MAKSLPAYIHRPKKARISATSFILSWLDRVSICTKQAVHPSIRCCLSRCLASTYTCMLPTQAPCMHIYIYIYMENFSYFYIHTRAIHPCTMAETAGHGCSRPTASLPCKPALLCVPSLDFLLQHMQTFKQIAPCMHVNNAS